MSKNYSIPEIKSLLQNAHNEINQILLNADSHNNNLYYQNFTQISFRTLKYLNSYLNRVNANQQIGSLIDSIISALNNSLLQYKSRNIFVDSCLTSPLAACSEDEKDEDQIYHFMNTRNTNIPLQCFNQSNYQRERLELAQFVQNMEKKKSTIKQPKRSLQLPKDFIKTFKVSRKTTYDPSLGPIKEEDSLSNPFKPLTILQSENDRNCEETETQTDLLGHQIDKKTEREEQNKSQTAFVSEMVMANSNVQKKQQSEQLKSSKKTGLQKKKSLKSSDNKKSKTKKKAHIAASSKQNDNSSSKSIKKSIKTIEQIEGDLSMNFDGDRENSLKSCRSRLAPNLLLSSKEVNISLNSLDNYNITINCQERSRQLEQKSDLLKSIQQACLDDAQLTSSNIKNNKEITSAHASRMEVIKETPQEHIHHPTKSELDIRNSQNTQSAKSSRQKTQEESHPSRFLQINKAGEANKLNLNSDIDQLSQQNQSNQINMINQNTIRHKKTKQKTTFMNSSQHYSVATVQYGEHASSQINDSKSQQIKNQIHASKSMNNKRLTLMNLRQMNEYSSMLRQDDANKQIKIASFIRNPKIKVQTLGSLNSIFTKLEQSLSNHANEQIQNQRDKQNEALQVLRQNGEGQQFQPNKYLEDYLRPQKQLVQAIYKNKTSQRSNMMGTNSSFKQFRSKYITPSDNPTQNMAYSLQKKQPIKQKSPLSKNNMIIINNKYKTENNIQKVKQTSTQKCVKAKNNYNKKNTSIKRNKITNQTCNSQQHLYSPQNSTMSSFKIRKQAQSNHDNKTQNIIPNESLSQFRPKKVLNSSLHTYYNSNALRQQSVKTTVPSNKRLKQIGNQRYIKSNHLSLGQGELDQISTQIRQKCRHQSFNQYLDLIELAHRKFCGQKCVHIQNLYKRIRSDGQKIQEGILDQLQRIIRKTK